MFVQRNNDMDVVTETRVVYEGSGVGSLSDVSLSNRVNNLGLQDSRLFGPVEANCTLCGMPYGVSIPLLNGISKNGWETMQ